MVGEPVFQRDRNPVGFTSPMNSAQRSRTLRSLLTPRTGNVLVHLMEHETPTHNLRPNRHWRRTQRQCLRNDHLDRAGCFSRDNNSVPREAGGSVHDQSISQTGVIGALSGDVPSSHFLVDGAPRSPSLDQDFIRDGL